MRSMAPGAKFSTSTSASRISFSITSLPSGVLVSSSSDRLLLLSIVKYSASRSGMSRNWRRVTSPPAGRSTFSTSAPNHASSCVHAGPACTPGEVDDFDSFEWQIHDQTLRVPRGTVQWPSGAEIRDGGGLSGNAAAPGGHYDSRSGRPCWRREATIVGSRSAKRWPAWRPVPTMETKADGARSGSRQGTEGEN